MLKEDLRKLLNKPYRQENWKKVIDFVFPNVSYLQVPKNIPFTSEKVESFGQIGTIRLNDGKNLALFEVHLFDNVNIARNRVELRNLVAPLIDQERNHGVLVIYEQGSDDYRFTFTAKETQFDEELNDFHYRETETKRFTYLLGSNEPCRTASERFWELSQNKNIATIHDVEKAFSVERLSKEFFTKYRLHYQLFVDYLYESNFKSSVFLSDEKAIRDFVKKMLGRIVFLHFVQKKAWLGASSNKFIDGDKNFMQLFWDKSEKGEDFYYRHLKRLFFEGVGEKDRPNLNFTLPSGEKTLIPYLGGGLFESENLDDKIISFPAVLFKSLFEFFGEYNFTIDENDPFENEVGIDPEMLGRIFENLLEDNKDKGAFYTPKPIVKYMCQESLIQYLLTSFEGHPKWRKLKEDNELGNLIDKFVRKYEAKDIIEYDTILTEALYKIKICDPAIGSGAFPMGLLLEILTLINVLHDASPDVVEDIWKIKNWQPSEIKKHIIQNSIYGVDIEKGAVDIARLRFWLSLVVDEEFPQPLPNLDYKIMQGNSLLEQFEGIDLSKSWFNNEAEVLQVNEPTLFEESYNKYSNYKEIQDNVTELILKYFTVDNRFKKQQIHKEIDGLVLSHIDASLKYYDNNLKKEIIELEGKLNDKLHRLSEEQKKVYLDNSKEFKEIKNKKVLLQKKSFAREKLVQLERQEERPYFLWHLFFKDVFDKGGFDIVIGNPPYIQLQKRKEDTDILETVGYQTFTRTGDIYCLFYEKGFNILKNKGLLTFITSNKWMSAQYGKNLRKYLIEKVDTITLIDFSSTVIFPAAVVFVNILIGKNQPNHNKIWTLKASSDYQLRRSDLALYIKEKGAEMENFTEESWAVAEREEIEIIKQIEKIGTPLRKWDFAFFRGITSGFNDAFFINKTTANILIKEDPKSIDLIKPLLRGKDIKRWVYTFQELFILNCHNGVREMDILPVNVEKDYPSIYKHLLQYYDKDSPKAIKLPDGTYQTLKDRQDQGDHWSNLRNCAFINEFEKEKIIWIEISDRANFCLDIEGHFLTNSAYFITGEHLKYLVGVLNSKIADFYLFKKTAQIAGGRKRYTKQYIELIPIPIISEDEMYPIECLSDYLTFINCLSTNQLISGIDNNEISKLFEDILNLAVCELYFNEHIQSLDLGILSLIDFPDISKVLNRNEKEKTVKNVWEKLQERENPIRNRLIVADSRSQQIIKLINQTIH